jgi:predicted amidohydrolase
MESFEYDLVITNGVCVTATDIASYDVAIKDEKVVLLARSGSLAGANACQIIDAEGGYVTVGANPRTCDVWPTASKVADRRVSPAAWTATCIFKSPHYSVVEHLPTRTKPVCT